MKLYRTPLTEGPLPTIRISELTGTEADLIEHFAPVAVEVASDFAGSDRHIG